MDSSSGGSGQAEQASATRRDTTDKVMVRRKEPHPRNQWVAAPARGDSLELAQLQSGVKPPHSEGDRAAEEGWKRQRRRLEGGATTTRQKEKGGFGPPFGTTEKLLRLWPNFWPGLRNHLEDSPLSPWHETRNHCDDTPKSGLAKKGLVQSPFFL